MEGSVTPQEWLTIPAHNERTATGIFIHGMGQSNLPWREVIVDSLAPKLSFIHWILPLAPMQSVSYHEGEYMPSWFDIKTLPPGPDKFDKDAISKSVATIEGLIQSLVQSGVDSRRILLIGFSQGAALSMMVSLKTNHALGGVVSLSGWIPPLAREMMTTTSHDIPILWCHGTTDQSIPISYGEDANAFLRDTVKVPQTKVQLFVYEGLDHTTREDELNDVASWLQDLLVV